MVARDYAEFLDRVKHRIAGEEDAPLVRIYHAVRNIPYGSAGMRDPRRVYDNNVGSCSGKHILLRDLLRRAGYRAEVITIFTHFNKGVPDNETYPDALRRMVREDEIKDFHHFVRTQHQGRTLKLDATWHDALAPYGFPVNADWRGDTDTVLAATSIREYAPVEDLPAFKQELLETLSPAERDKRHRFFRLLGEWIAAL